jgi:hypothetical protein
VFDSQAWAEAVIAVMTAYDIDRLGTATWSLMYGVVDVYDSSVWLLASNKGCKRRKQLAALHQQSYG